MNTILFRIFLLLMLIFTISSSRTHKQRVNDYLQAVENAKAKVENFKQAIKSKDPIKIKKATLKIQEDPAAIKELNKESNLVKKKFVDITESIQSKTIENIKQKVAKKYGVRPEDVNVKKFTNPSSKVKAGHDWDVTVTVKGDDIPYQKVQDIVHDSYFEASGGKKAYPNKTAKEFAEAHHVEVTSKGHAEAYEGGKEYIDNTKTHKVNDPERLSKTIEHKSDLDYKKAKEYAGAKEYAKSEVYKHEHARQYTKQYESHIKPRIKEMGGRIPDNIRKGTNILKKIGKYDKALKRTYTPADADVDLAKMGETAESIIKKGSALVESGQKLGPRTKEHRLKKKLGHAQEELETAFQKGDKRGIRKAKNKIARTKAELKQEQLKTAQHAEGKTSVKSGKATGTASVAEEGIAAKGAKATGKVLETAGTGVVIFNTAQDVKESLQGKKSWKETGENAADLATAGAISATKHTIEKNRDAKESIEATHKAQKSENEAEILARGLSLREKGVSKEETEKIMEDMRHGSDKSFFKKVHELRKQGKIIPLTVAKHVDIEEPDDTYTERAKAVKEGLIDYGKRAGKFVKETGEDVKEITEGSIETQKNIYKSYKGNKEADAQLEQIKKRLIKEGISPEGAQIAIERFKDGHKNTLRNIIKKLNKKRLEKEKIAKEKLEEKREELLKKAKALIEKAQKADKLAKAKAAKERLRKKLEQIKKEKLSKKAKSLIEQADKADSDAEAAKERLKEKIAKSKKEDISNKAKALLAQADKADTETHTKYKNMTQEEKHEALKKNSDEAWEGLKKDLLNGRTDEAIKALSVNKNSSKNVNKTVSHQLYGTIRGSWSGKGKFNGVNVLFHSKGKFKMKISKNRRVSGYYTGDDKGRLSGHINSSGKIRIKSGGGMAGNGSWSGHISIDSNGVLHGSGHWRVSGFSGSWRGSGR